MDDEGRKAAPKAGRRAGRNVNSWADDSTAPVEVQKGGFGLDAGFEAGSSTQPALRQDDFDTEDISRQGPRTHVNNDGDTPLTSRSRTEEAGGEHPSAQRLAPSDKFSTADTLREDSKKFVGVSRRKQEQLARGDDEISRKNLKYEALTAGVDGIMDIPELEDEGREDLSNVVAEAPKVRTNKVQGIEELEEDMHFKLPAMDDRDIDLSLLTGVLCSSEQVQELDEPWDPEIILTEVASAIYMEREKAEGQSFYREERRLSDHNPVSLHLASVWRPDRPPTRKPKPTFLVSEAHRYTDMFYNPEAPPVVGVRAVVDSLRAGQIGVTQAVDTIERILLGCFGDAFRPGPVSNGKAAWWNDECAAAKQAMLQYRSDVMKVPGAHPFSGRATHSVTPHQYNNTPTRTLNTTQYNIKNTATNNNTKHAITNNT
ncbi:hypothetical protein VOLCADRAFT_107874 [Volvox carteri f. nagariensis]|uniref:MOT41f n=1 Tax=Volvox carteri f. nagariensis TaxID=3068 RepID=D8UGZ5_VOLCA|nr:uncharacterized protein VOLCADRAFT_107874 [Volvox carteri f. nagariensis]ADI46873.1 MOT41f [Volvox carteri f. nagariensis]EFJ40955.1 hypothetical protein VOLCADRAFT_107874 [Volvox carteri f. nagariensis]|eukprot:XP_002957929.1 hypothetical protein VOLCADRAFT_107874 [Volvox carteri f. nagariensis]